MWIVAVVLAALAYFAVRLYYGLIVYRDALTIYATDLLLRPELHQRSAAKLREIILREPRHSRPARIAVEKEVLRAIHEWAVEATAARSGVPLESIVARA